MPVRLAVVSLWVEDVPAAAHFYHRAIGLPLIAHHDERPHFDLGGSTLVILHGTPAPARNAISERFPIIALRVDDLDAAIARLETHGVSLPWGVETDSRSRWVMFYDPGGNLIELVQFVY